MSQLQASAAQAVADLGEGRGRSGMDVQMQEGREPQLGQGTAVTSASA